MVADFHYSSFIKDDYLVGILNSTQSVCYNNNSFALIELIKVFDYSTFVVSIK